VLPVSLASDPWFLERFYREAQAVAALDHPNIVRAHDIDRDGILHFLVMEYVDGTSLQEIVGRHGTMDIFRAAHYVRQAALGLQHAFEIGFVHRDIKPANLLLDRQGTVKILDMGLAHFVPEEQRKVVKDKSKERRIVGTDDYLAPEQIVNSDAVDIRADIYGLGATLYFLLTGNAPFQDVAVDHQKLIRHLTRNPKPVRELRPEVPEGLAAVVARMMAKNPWERYQLPKDVAVALDAWTQKPIGPPPALEMPSLSPAARQSRAKAMGLERTAGRPSGGKSWVLATGTQAAPSHSVLLSEIPGTTEQAQTATSQDTQSVGANDRNADSRHQGPTA
jgi:serine/threonine protein kinase